MSSTIFDLKNRLCFILSCIMATEVVNKEVINGEMLKAMIDEVPAPIPTPVDNIADLPTQIPETGELKDFYAPNELNADYQNRIEAAARRREKIVAEQSKNLDKHLMNVWMENNVDPRQLPENELAMRCEMPLVRRGPVRWNHDQQPHNVWEPNPCPGNGPWEMCQLKCEVDGLKHLAANYQAEAQHDYTVKKTVACTLGAVAAVGMLYMQFRFFSSGVDFFSRK